MKCEVNLKKIQRVMHELVSFVEVICPCRETLNKDYLLLQESWHYGMEFHIDAPDHDHSHPIHHHHSLIIHCIIKGHA